LLFFIPILTLISFLEAANEIQNLAKPTVKVDNDDANEEGNLTYHYHSEVDVGEHQLVKMEESHSASELSLANESLLEEEQVDLMLPSHSSSQPEPPASTGRRRM